ncbi:BON domain-containing protein [Caldimonas thermodepolymerans]|jgi:Predicted periplasmic or secreted lipoprotein|uniref:BON domain-containing protein n=1 Tax=Caldimonas thermodepolymerans TaxID=215580 RepID=A0A2S5T957_9BURK|nr:BON domain-containing protein [Caldimonas thermodepolymerans]PPE71540.1 hypothetical protein C1702_00630 [Caldimonas thermodepolymerans]QPC30566.1 BON domain-containing protein [Caldimonas thermodepolymerans]RDI02839.1 BON domain-containing protein [Caldimonas thermodepolymerans]TCP08631.1 BON domain-containing protein [Caldimonas thermodepolymerans]UZG43292.1 BON domain-containing protein [Caldimonas thermodepolymerans]
MKALTLMGTLAAAVALTACGRPDDGTAARSTDAPVVAQAEPRDESLGERTAQAARDAGDAMERGAERAGDAIGDAAITASVNSELARDDELSALGIDVDTDNGRVTMSGTAPNEAARERATQLASAVRGVVSVDNQLRIENQGDAQPAQ